MLPLSRQLADELDLLSRAHQLRALRPTEGRSGAHVLLDGAELLSFSSNDYLGIAAHAAVIKAATDAAHRSGFGASASRLAGGTFSEHQALEAALALFLGTEAALLFPSGYQANLGVLTALAGPGDLIVADRSIHASLIDGCRLSRAKLALYRHLDLERAASLLQTFGPRARRRFLVTESIFSMDGDVAPLPHLAALARQSEASLVVDEAHAVGVLGPSGRGLSAATGVQPDVLIGTLGKALGASGAFVAGDHQLSAYLQNRARSFIFTTALPPPVAAAALAALAIASSSDGDGLRAHLAALVARLRLALGYPRPDPPSPILPILLGDNHHALAAAKHLENLGFLVPAIRPPTVRPGTARLRISLSASHTPADIDALAAALLPLLPSRRPTLPSPNPAPPPPARFPSPALSPRRGLTLLGTDTGVGKTTVGVALLRLLAARGLRPVPFKPVETGATPQPADALALLRAADRSDLPLELVCPFPFPAPIAPLAAAAQTGVPLTLSSLLEAATATAPYGGPLVTESAGGVLTPYAPRVTAADLASALRFPVLLVARNALGTVNHTALAVAELRRRGLPIAGIILVDTQPAPDAAREHNASLITQLTALAPLGTLPFLPTHDATALSAALASSVDLAPLLEVLI